MATLSELKQKNSLNPENLQKVTDLKQIAPPKAEENTAQEIFNQEMSDLDKELFGRMEKDEKRMEEEYAKHEEIVEDAVFDAPVEDIDKGLLTEEEADKALSDVFTDAVKAVNEDENVKAGVEAVNNVGKNTVSPENMEFEDLLKDLDDDDSFDEDDDPEITEFDDDEASDDDESDNEEDQKKMLQSIKDQVNDVIKPFTNIIDLKSFKISTKPKSASSVLREVKEGPTATWVLLDSETPFTCTALGAVEIENLDPKKINDQNGRIDALKQMYGTLYRHYISANKPATLEQWVKTISYSDQDNLIFGYYKATFGQSNLITYGCEKCKNVKIENVPIENCIKYKDDKTKEEVEKILKYGDPTHKSEIKAKLIQVSDTLAVSVKNPSIYNIVFEFGVLDADFTRKFADVLGTVGFIEDIYVIDTENMQLCPIKVTEVPGNITKSVKRRIRSKVEILKGLTPDQYNILTGEIAELSKNAERISYCQPEYKCEKCGNTINESVMSSQELLFIRHQLALIKTLSVE